MTAAALMLAALAPGCTHKDEPPRVLRLAQVRPSGSSGVFLNERLVLHFSEPLDPTSVHPHSVRVVDQDDIPARGDLEVVGARLMFAPAPVRSPDLSDGGFRPGTRYTIQLAGFPRPDGLRGRSGAPLERSLERSFETVEVREPRSDFVFEDGSLGVGLPLVLRSERLAPGDPIELEGEEPLDPSTLHGEDFVLRMAPSADPGAPGERARLGEPIALRARLADNSDRRAIPRRGTAMVHLEPQRLLEPGTYLLATDPETLRLRDFGGNPVPVLAEGGPRARPGRPMRVTVTEPAGPAASTFYESFLGTEMRSIEPVEGADGSLWWGDSGRAEVRWPAAAGAGTAGRVRLEGALAERDLQALSIEVPSGARCTLTETPGLVVLRAQGSLRIAGGLERAAAGERLELPPRGQGQTLSAWLADARARDSGCTVLIAGGDLVISGEVTVQGPLLLVAGGRLRVSGRDALRAREVHVLGEGGLRVPFQELSSGTYPYALDAGLVLDPPEANPLAAPLVFAARSGPIPRVGTAARWLAAKHGGSTGSHGEVRVRFIGELQRPEGRQEVIVDDPRLLRDCGSLRLLIELEVRPGERWDPPWLDHVEIGWEPAGERKLR